MWYKQHVKGLPVLEVYCMLHGRISGGGGGGGGGKIIEVIKIIINPIFIQELQL